MNAANDQSPVAGGRTTAIIPTYDSVEVGTVLPPLSLPITRTDLIKYAGASGDFNIIHWNDRVATEVGLPGVIAHGMLSMAKAAQVVTSWVGDPGRIIEYTARFAKPVVVPDDDGGATLEITGRIAQKLDNHQVRVDLSAKCGTEKTFSIARLVVRLD